MNKYVECQNCKNSYDCERTYLGGCTDGEKWEENKLTDEEIIEELSGCLLKTSCDDCKLDRLECQRLAVEQIHRLQKENEFLKKELQNV